MMTVGQLKNLLSRYDDDTPLVIAADQENAIFSLLDGIDTLYIRINADKKTVLAVESDEQKALLALVFWPTLDSVDKE